LPYLDDKGSLNALQYSSSSSRNFSSMTGFLST
jgi:hypothetical protein